MVDVFLPSATHIRDTDAFAGDVGKHIQEMPGVTHVTSFIGGGGLRFLLVYTPEQENRAFVQFLVDVDDPAKMDALIADIQKYLDDEQPNANAVVKKFLLGPNSGGRIQTRFSGPDPAELRKLADQARQILEDDGGAVCVRSDWRQREKVVRPELFELQAMRNGITRVEVAQALQAGFEGRVVGFYREPGNAGAGIYPQESPAIADRGTPADQRAQRRRGDPQHADLEPGCGTNDPAEPSFFRRGSRLGRSGGRAPRSLPDDYGSCRSAFRVTQQAVQSSAAKDRADRIAAGLFARMGRRIRRFNARPALPWLSRCRWRQRLW